MPATLEEQIQKSAEEAKKLEVYRYVRLSDLLSQDFTLPIASSSPCSHIPEGVIVLPLNEALKTYGGFLKPRIAQLRQEEKDPFAKLNGEHHQNALFIYVPPKMKTEITLDHFVPEGQTPTFLNPRIHFFIGKEAHVTIRTALEGDFAPIWINSVIDFALEAGACVHYVTQGEKKPSWWHFEAIRATLKEESLFKTYSVTEGCATSRQDYQVRLLGERSEAALYGMWNLKERSHHHVNILLEHHVPYCTSLQKFKGVLDDTARSSFEGKIYVHKEAQKTEAYQMNNNLILGKRAAAYTKPNLEIFADDVKASHGATVGRLDPEHLFYLKTRGVPEKVAHKLLVKGFTEEISALIP